MNMADADHCMDVFSVALLPHWRGKYIPEAGFQDHHHGPSYCPFPNRYV